MNFELLDHHHKNRSKHGKWNHNDGETSNRRSAAKPFYYKLAPETPLPASLDESSYDSFHNLETGGCSKIPNIIEIVILQLLISLDVCKDSSDDDNSDTNSSHTEGFAVLDVITEYDLADDSESEDGSTASSGTDVRTN